MRGIILIATSRGEYIVERAGQSSFEYIFMIAAALLVILIVITVLKTQPHSMGSQLVESGESAVSEALQELSSSG